MKKKANKTTNALVPAPTKVNALYKRMQTAIADCHSIDDCKNIATQASAIAAYYAQIKDDVSVRKFLQVKLRAWRRIGEILATVDKSGCDNTAAYIRKIKATFGGRKDIEELTESAFRQALKVAEVPADFFEENVTNCQSIEGIVGAFAQFKDRLWRESPEGKAQLERQRRAIELTRKQDAKEAEKRRIEQIETATRFAEEQAALKALEKARDDAFHEVGITLERRYRKDMKQIVFLIRDSIYETLRQAAFDNRVTMQSVLRSGLMMWFIAHGYKVQAEDMSLPEGKQTREHDVRATYERRKQ